MSQFDALVGHRVVIRSTVPGERGPSGGPALTDVIGRLLAHDGTRLRIQRRDGSEVEVAVSTVVAAKTVPEGRARARTRPALDYSPEELAEICTRGWPPRVLEKLGAWTLRAAGGFTGRANSAGIHGDPGTDFADAVTRIEEFYAAHGLPPKAQVIDETPWARRFADAGWVGIGGTHDHAVVQVADLATVLSAPLAPPTSAEVTLEPTLSDAWLAAAERDASRYEEHDVRHVLASPPIVRFASVRGDEGLEAVARMVVTGEWAGLSSVHTTPYARRRGHAGRLLEVCAAWARDEGADKVFLQTMRHNAPALALYARYGFVTHHSYRYVTPPA
ncbi:GNAT family N-acetyltransferase [Mumia sp. ZJ1417]|uniref:GNAT family N-acetyltransferase n=1 Tax=unclassified Mumia TaxID=2621872 RepID=UPI001420B2EE|nr:MULTISPECIES: GNAT family N-acetyltransferase [unclassified Mumia]QMW67246.1 GNAT family N-acetyltransferase [Mumia sp. ZJ1417]